MIEECANLQPQQLEVSVFGEHKQRSCSVTCELPHTHIRQATEFTTLALLGSAGVTELLHSKEGAISFRMKQARV